jgi:hypothetical protein
MNAIPHETTWDEEPVGLTGRPRRRYGGPASAILLALVLGVVGFYVGVRVEKGQLSSSSAAPVSAAAGASSRTGATRGSAGAFPRAFAGGSANGFTATFGTVSSMNHGTLYVTEINGNTVKVMLSSATKVTKSMTAGKNSIRPGDTVSIQGLGGSSGSIAAASVSDSGARTAGGGFAGAAGAPGAAGGAGGSSAGNAAVNSLFGSGR